MRKIAFVVCNISNIGGTERAVINLCNSLCRNPDTSVSIISMYSEDKKSIMLNIDNSIKIFHLQLNSNNRIKCYLSYFSFIRCINKLITDEKFDIIVGTTHAMNCLFTFCNKKAKFIGWEHTIYHACPKLSRIIRKNKYKKLDAVVILTSSDACNYSFLDKNKTFVIPNILSFTVEKPAALTNKRIITAGRLTPVKRFELLIKLSKELKKSLPGWELCIFGDGEQKELLSNQIQNEELSDFVKLMGNTNNIRKELYDSSILVMTSKYEGLPMILIEGQACGLPIVAFDCPEGPRNIISDQENGYLIPMDDEKSFIDRVVSLANDFNHRKILGDNAFVTSERYKPEQVVKLWLDAFNSVFKE